MKYQDLRLGLELGIPRLGMLELAYCGSIMGKKEEGWIESRRHETGKHHS